MYQGFFGLNEIPFSIAPNPEYLYMSERHKEALAHLMFGLNETGGFVLLTGEVGTGKTTVSRALLAQIPENTQVAFVLNPGLSQWELLASICDEFNIKYDATNTSVKVLTDAIKAYLLTAQKNDQRCLLIIDEAQHLRAEVLEQLRLLTNLETNTRKLLQVILIGQPELQALLKRQELRQLAQRITARYHLLPLDENQVAFYINHRMQVAGCPRAVFTRSSIKRIYQISQGIPRIINLLCDRALMGAYVKQQDKVDRQIVEQAAKEALDYESPSNAGKTWLKVGAILSVCALSALALYTSYQLWLMQPVGEKSEQTEQAKHSTLNYDSPPQSVDKTDQQTRMSEQAQYPLPSAGVNTAMKNLASVWQVSIEPDSGDICEQIQSFELSCAKWRGSVSQLAHLNIPMVLELNNDKNQIQYALLEQIIAPKSAPGSNIRYQLSAQQKSVTVETNWLASNWRGQAILFWQPPRVLSGQQINANSSVTQIQWLENQLSVLLQQTRRKVTTFDSQLSQKLNRFQRQHGLSLTPFADIDTLISIQQLSLQHTPKLLQE
ncbi:ExeA family protein [Gayadomonas joobiniege]|uniref:ExeA family protein n=1 Tax=Gayadomonas joobiniege TaxID=1234606 RepID=UPI00058E269A|nr:AAA family ATPase [Gayadomonas joobiniege]